MSGLLDLIVRRRRASAATRLGPPTENGRHRDDPYEGNGAPPLEEVALESPSPPEDVAAESPARRSAPAGQSAPARRPARTRQPAGTRPQMRRRARFLRQLREVQLRDIGGFLLECYRFDRPRPELVEAKVQDALETDRELRALEQALREERPRDEVRQPGIGGACPECGSVHGSGDRFCAWCGHRL